MQWLDNIKNALFLRRQKDKILAVGCSRQPLNWVDCHHVAVLFNASDTANLPAVFQHIRLLIGQGKNVHSLGYWQGVDLTDAPTQYPVFNRRNLSFSNVPAGELVDNFSLQIPDVLIGLYRDNIAPLDYLMATSRAKFCAGFYSSQRLDWLDFALHTDNADLDVSIKNLHAQLVQINFK